MSNNVLTRSDFGFKATKNGSAISVEISRIVENGAPASFGKLDVEDAKTIQELEFAISKFIAQRAKEEGKAFEFVGTLRRF